MLIPIYVTLVGIFQSVFEEGTLGSVERVKTKTLIS